MARRPRINLAGWHHVINRGVDRGDVYRSDEDKEKFLSILCKACHDYRVNVHDYCLMDNHYHLLVETTSDNLSLFMRQLSSNYAIYFNKRYHRTGHLWQGRYQSWYIVNQEYLYSLFRYIEHNPIEAKISTEVGEYPYTLLATLLNPAQHIIPCARHSRLLAEYDNPELCNRNHLSLADHCSMGMCKASSINLQVNLKCFANTHKTSIRQGINDSIA